MLLTVVALAAGKLFHSGLPHKSINPIELAMDAVTEIQRRFYADFPPHPEEARCGRCRHHRVAGATPL